MYDIKWIRENPDAFDAALGRRGLKPKSFEVLAIDEKHRATIREAQKLQALRNERSKAVAKTKQMGGDANDLMVEVIGLKARLQSLEHRERKIGAELTDMLAEFPNMPAAEVPDGTDESANRVLPRDSLKPRFDFTPKQHFEIGEAMGLMDFDVAAKLSGARFVVLKGALARLERALAAFMLDIHTNEFGYTEVSPPILVRDAAMIGTGQLPKFKEDLFSASGVVVSVSPDLAKIDDLGGGKFDVEFKNHVDQKWFNELSANTQIKVVIGLAGEKKRVIARENFWLIPTAEVPLTNLVRESVLEEKQLPMRFTALTPCFRAEAGAAGKDTRGMLRQHQFSKVEMVSVTTPEQSEEEHERMTACAEEILKRLGVHYRVVVLSTGDMGFSARKTYDIEAWLPGQNAYREISSCSNCWDFQARRMEAKFRTSGQGKREYVHTLNGSGLAVGRTLIAVLENYQRADGSVEVPDALRSYMGGLDVIPGPGA